MRSAQRKKYDIKFPYVPTFLSFREAEPIVETFSSLRKKPEVLLVDGHGIAHPREIGLASHVGVLLETPTIGVAKKILVGEYNRHEDVGGASKILHKGRTVGFALNSRRNSKPIFVSPGHLVSLEKSLEVVKKCIKGHRLPEPLRLAHELSSKAKHLPRSSGASQC